MLNPIFTQDLRKLINENAEKINNLQDFLSEEQLVGTWFGKKLYKRTLYRTKLINGGYEIVKHNIPDVDTMWSDPSYSFAIWQNGLINHIPYMNLEQASNSIAIYDFTTTSFTLKSGMDRTNLSGYITLLYTKTTDK